MSSRSVSPNRSALSTSKNYSIESDLTNGGFVVFKIFLNGVNIGNIRYSSFEDEFNLKTISNLIKNNDDFLETNKEEGGYLSVIENNPRKNILYFAILDREEFPIAEVCLHMDDKNRIKIADDLRKIDREIKDNLYGV